MEWGHHHCNLLVIPGIRPAPEGGSLKKQECVIYNAYKGATAMKTFNEWMGTRTTITKKQAVDMLFSILDACNSVDSDQNTDFPSHAASQRSTYGHIVEAIKSLGAGAEYDHWVATNER